jgi:hypothetical protein
LGDAALDEDAALDDAGLDDDDEAGREDAALDEDDEAGKEDTALDEDDEAGAPGAAGLTETEMPAGSLGTLAVLYDRTVSVCEPRMAFQFWITVKLVWGLGGASLRVVTPSTKSSTRLIPTVSSEVDCTITLSPSLYVLPLGGAVITMVGLSAVPVNVTQAVRPPVAKTRASKNNLTANECFTTFSFREQALEFPGSSVQAGTARLITSITVTPRSYKTRSPILPC